MKAFLFICAALAFGDLQDDLGNVYHTVKDWVGDRLTQLPPQKVPSGKCAKTVNGQLAIEKETVKTATRINGQLKAHRSTFTELIEVNGQAKCTQCTFSGDVLLRGDSGLRDCTFKSNLEIIAKNVTLRGCKVKTLYITNPMKLTGLYRGQLYLRDGSQVEKVVFSKPGGIVHVSSDSKLTTVKNGKRK